MKPILLILTFSVLTGCMTVTSPFCNENNASDVPNFAGSFKLSMMGEDVKTDVEKIGSARYRIIFKDKETGDESNETTTCQVNGSYYAQVLEESKDYSLTKIDLQGEVMMMEMMSVDTVKLESMNIPYRSQDSEEGPIVTVINEGVNSSMLEKAFKGVQPLVFKRIQ